MTEWFGNETQLTKEDFIKKIKTDNEFAKQWGDLGPIYGKQWREWNISNGYEPIDQIQNLIEELKNNPDSRRLMVSAWNVGKLDEMVLPPCHYGFQLYTRELSLNERLKYWTDSLGKSIHYADDFGHSKLDSLKVPKRTISLMWNQRSVDTFLGLPFNIASYGLLLMLIADEVGMIADELIGNLGDTHLYLNHIEQAKQQIGRIPYKLPTVHIRDGIESFMPGDIILENYQFHPSIKAPLSN
jgi:thymidylate synthase